MVPSFSCPKVLFVLDGNNESRLLEIASCIEDDILWEIRIAHTVQEACHQLESSYFDLVILEPQSLIIFFLFGYMAHHLYPIPGIIFYSETPHFSKRCMELFGYTESDWVQDIFSLKRKIEEKIFSLLSSHGSGNSGT